ncbi:MAG: hypothetical protein NUV91_09795 [Candidatus Omnitrophica bacterium]|nr:hypothetical protein [Candidatus Omnitrophota bacterium]
MSCLKSFLSLFLVLSLAIGGVYPQQAGAAGFPELPALGVLDSSASYIPVLLKGIRVFQDNPFRFDFIADTGDTQFDNEALKQEMDRLVKYFLATLTIPDEDLWVNLSPHEKDRIIPEQLAITELGRDMLAQDYLLKQMTASMIYPEKDLGKKFWDKVYRKASELYGTTSIPVNTFNKVWIVPESAVVYENGESGFVVESKLNVMLEEDYLARNEAQKKIKIAGADSNVSSEIIRQIILPEIKKEVNEGQHFVPLRQIYTAMILATWFKQKLKKSLLGESYIGQNKVEGINLDDKRIKEKIYSQYLEAFKKGVYSYIKEEVDPATKQMIPRKYFAGGEEWRNLGNDLRVTTAQDAARRVLEDLSKSGRQVNVPVALRPVNRLYEILQDHPIKKAWPQATASEIIEVLLMALKQEGLIEEAVNEFGQVEVRILEGARGSELGQLIYNEVVRPQEEEIGIPAINFPSSKDSAIGQGRWMIVGFKDDLDDPQVRNHEREEVRRLEEKWKALQASGQFAPQEWEAILAETHNEVVRDQDDTDAVMIPVEDIAAIREGRANYFVGTGLKDRIRELAGRFGRNGGDQVPMVAEAPPSVPKYTMAREAGRNLLATYFRGEVILRITDEAETIVARLRVLDPYNAETNPKPQWRVGFWDADGAPIEFKGIDPKLKKWGLLFEVVPGKTDIHSFNIRIHMDARLTSRPQIEIFLDDERTEADFESALPLLAARVSPLPEEGKQQASAPMVAKPRGIVQTKKTGMFLLPTLMGAGAAANATRVLMALGDPESVSPLAAIVSKGFAENGKPRYAAALRAGGAGYGILEQPFEDEFAILDSRTGRLFNFWIERTTAGAGGEAVYFLEYNPETLEPLPGQTPHSLPVGTETSVYLGLGVQVAWVNNGWTLSALIRDAGGIEVDNLRNPVYVEWTPALQTVKLGKSYESHLDPEPFVGGFEIYDTRRWRYAKFELEDGKIRIERFRLNPDLTVGESLDQSKKPLPQIWNKGNLGVGITSGSDVQTRQGEFYLRLGDVRPGERGVNPDADVFVRWYPLPVVEATLKRNSQLIDDNINILALGEDSFHAAPGKTQTFPTDNIWRLTVELNAAGEIVKWGKDAKEKTLDVLIRAQDYERDSWKQAKFYLDQSGKDVLARRQKKQDALRELLLRKNFTEAETLLQGEADFREIDRRITSPEERVRQKRVIFDKLVEQDRKRQRIVNASLEAASRRYEEALRAEANLREDEMRLIGAVVLLSDEGDHRADALNLLRDPRALRTFEFNSDIARVYQFYDKARGEDHGYFARSIRFFRRELASTPAVLQQYFEPMGEIPSVFDRLTHDHRALYALDEWAAGKRVKGNVALPAEEENGTVEEAAAVARAAEAENFTPDETRLIVAIILQMRGDPEGALAALQQDESIPGFQITSDIAREYDAARKEYLRMAETGDERDSAFIKARDVLRAAVRQTRELSTRFFMGTGAARDTLATDPRALAAFERLLGAVAESRGASDDLAATGEGQVVVQRRPVPSARELTQAQESPPASVRAGRQRGDDEAIFIDDTVGGIDFNPSMLDLKTKGEFFKMDAPFDPSILKDSSFDGLSPFIIEIRPITNFPLLLGISQETSETKSTAG